MANKCFIKRNGQWVSFSPMKKVNGQWQRCPVYKKENGVWNRIDQQLVTKTKVISGYAQWNGSFRNSSGSGVAEASYSGASDKLRIYQGRYSSYHHLGVMCFTDLFNQARNTGTITKVVLKLKNNHAYYNSGLKTIISGAVGLPSSRPGSLSFGVSNGADYSGKISFAKNGSEHKAIALNSACCSAIQNNQINGFKLTSPTGFSLNDYGYFEGVNGNRPYIEITVQYQVWE